MCTWSAILAQSPWVTILLLLSLISILQCLDPQNTFIIHFADDVHVQSPQAHAKVP